MSLKVKSNYKFWNWARTYSCEPEKYFEPTNTDEIRSILKLAKKNNKKVKVEGSGLSPSDIACTGDYMISLKHFCKVLDIDEKRHTITVEAGITLAELNDRILPSNDLAFSNLASVSGQTVGGMIATGCHGSGGQFGSFSSHILQLTLMLADGSIIECSNSHDEEKFSAVCCHLGILGIVLSVKLQCEPAFHLHRKRSPGTLTDVLDNLDNLIASSQHFLFHWYPHTDYVAKMSYNRTKSSVSTRSNWFWNVLIGYYLLEFCLWVSTFFPSIIPSITKFFYKFCYSEPLEEVNRSDRIFNIECLFKQHVTEWAIPRRHTAAMLLQMRDWLRNNRHVKVHFPVEARFVKKDGIMMAPSGDEDVTYIGIISFRPYGKDVSRNDWWNFFENLALNYEGKPHWAKQHKVTGKTLQKLYRKYDSFMSIREEFDPENIFINDYWKRIIEN